MPRAAALALLLAALLAGCAGGPNAPDGTPGTSGATPAPTSDGPVEAAAPVWSVGDHWDHHWYIGDGTGGEFDFRVKVLVAEDAGPAWRLAAGDLSSALFHAAFFFPDLGAMSKSDWTTRAGGFAYPWYDFPLTDGKAWRAQESNLDFNLEPVERSLDFKAAWVAPAGGVPGHYLVEAREGGNLRAAYDYRPDLGWFSEYRAFDGSEADPAAPMVRIQTETYAHGYTGPWFDAVAEPLLSHTNFVAPASGAVTPAPAASFTMDSAMTHLFAIQFSFAAGGFHDTELVAPDGSRHGYQAFEANGAAFSDGEDILILPAQAGEWRVVTNGAGAFAAGGGVLAWGATVTEGTL